ncbi:hypothetical protein [Xenorhabdus sp. KJ12.1]|uniref:hypothetical protein n=1 Tax=Xenorhabdus sp. KJ12.1 TaxID=1851571 RepID=UPI000C047489|nr:hypothetical protein [Xenorhabdus sp. KJ12.1]PHM69489.1 hypothetical protein Xekj_02457 [Xenorhabdus sp. KJ12.1]
MHNYFICLVAISPYEGADYVIGVFDELALAEQAKAQFSAILSTNEKGGLEMLKESENRLIEIEEVKIVEHQSDTLFTKPIYIASLFKEGFGQTIRVIEAIVEPHDAALQKIKELEARSDASEPTFPEYFSLEKLVINQLNPQSANQWLENDYFGDVDDYLVWK